MTHVIWHGCFGIIAISCILSPAHIVKMADLFKVSKPTIPCLKNAPNFEEFPIFFQTEPLEKFLSFISPSFPSFSPFSLLFFLRTEPVEKESGTPRLISKFLVENFKRETNIHFNCCIFKFIVFSQYLPTLPILPRSYVVHASNLL